MKFNLNAFSVTFMILLVRLAVEQKFVNDSGSKNKNQQPKIAKNLENRPTDRKTLGGFLSSPVIRIANDEIAIDSDNIPSKEIAEHEANKNDHDEFNNEFEENDEHNEEIEPEVTYNIRNIRDIDQDLIEIKNIIRKEVLANLSITLILKKLEISYQMYKKLNDIRKAYALHRNEIKSRIKKIMKIADNSKEQMERLSKLDDVQEIFKDANAKYDNYNKRILTQLIFKFQENVETLWHGLSQDLDDFFVDLEHLHYDLTLSDEEKVAKMIKVAVNVSTFETDIINEKIEQIESIKALILDNPKYHHLTDLEDPEELLDEEDKAQTVEDKKDEENYSSIITPLMIGAILIILN